MSDSVWLSAVGESCFPLYQLLAFFTCCPLVVTIAEAQFTHEISWKISKGFQCNHIIFHIKLFVSICICAFYYHWCLFQQFSYGLRVQVSFLRSSYPEYDIYIVYVLHLSMYPYAIVSQETFLLRISRFNQCQMFVNIV